MTDSSEIKRLAEAAGGVSWEWWTSNSVLRLTTEKMGRHGPDGDALSAHGDNVACPEVYRDFIAAANPAAVLGMIADLERNQRMLLAACLDMGAIGSALGADMNSDGEELLSLVVDVKAENKRMRSFLSDISKTSGDKGAVMGARQVLKEFGCDR
ncbi:hypothetical protein [Pseudomonas sp. NA-150]|uniref:hypothetical protein n=1 Tax=Pseudomonas sp. NA-150 TaxID=3367525 RepID=UPI0037CC1F38